MRLLDDLTEANVDVRRHDITKDDVEASAFDFAHCRSLLVHVSDPAAVLRRMVAALRPGGWLLAEEPYFDVITAADDGHPLAEVFNKSFPLRFQFLSDAGIMDSVLGRSLPELMEQAGLVEVDNEGSTDIARGGDPASSNWLSVWERLDGYLVAEGVLDQSDVDDTRLALMDPTFRYLNGVTFSAWGKRPH